MVFWHGRKRTDNLEPETTRGSKEIESTTLRSSAKGRPRLLARAITGASTPRQSPKSEQFYCRIARSKLREHLAVGCLRFPVLASCSSFSPCLRPPAEPLYLPPRAPPRSKEEQGPAKDALSHHTISTQAAPDAKQEKFKLVSENSRLQK